MSQYKIKELPLEERPRERLKLVGVNNLTNKEILSIILKSGTKDKNVNELSIEVLKKYSLLELKNVSIQDLMKIKGIGEVKALELLAAIELGKRIYLKEPKKLIKLENPKDIWESSKYLFNGVKQEYFYGYYFNNKQEGHIVENHVLSSKSVIIYTFFFDKVWNIGFYYYLCSDFTRRRLWL